MPRILRALFWTLLRVFFRRVEVRGTPPEGAVLYVANHPSALVDPALVYCYAPQMVSFLAKEPLFRMPFVSWFVKSINSLPVYRKMDGANTKNNQRTLEAAKNVLQNGGAIALFPEGTSHSDPQMKPLKTGAARMALGARALGAPVKIVPVGLHYTDKSIFRSDALVTFGPAIEVPKISVGEDGEPPREEALALTDQIRQALDDLVVQAVSDDALDLCKKAEAIFSAAETNDEADVARQAELLHTFTKRYDAIKQVAPNKLEQLSTKIHRHQQLLDQLGLPASHPHLKDFTAKNVANYSLRNLVLLTLWAPLAVIGWLWHAPAYYAVRAIAFLSKGEIDQTATVKVLASLLLFPASWLAAGAAVGFFVHWISGIAVALAGPCFGYLILTFKERIEDVSFATRALTVFFTRRAHLARLSVSRQVIREDILALGEQAQR